MHFFVFGDKRGDVNQIKCGTLMNLGRHNIWKGEYMKGVSNSNVIKLDGTPLLKPGESATAKPFDKSRVYTTTVTIDIKNKFIEMDVDGEKMRQPLPLNIVNEIKYIGYVVNGSRTAFSEIEQVETKE